MDKLEKEIRKIAVYLGCNDGELVIEIKKTLQNTSPSELLAFIKNK